MRGGNVVSGCPVFSEKIGVKYDKSTRAAVKDARKISICADRYSIKKHVSGKCHHTGLHNLYNLWDRGSGEHDVGFVHTLLIPFRADDCHKNTRILVELETISLRDIIRTMLQPDIKIHIFHLECIVVTILRLILSLHIAWPEDKRSHRQVNCCSFEDRISGPYDRQTVNILASSAFDWCF